ncbi:MAG: SpoIID/LytB domain-containing protein [Anaerolineae bacterium]
MAHHHTRRRFLASLAAGAAGALAIPWRGILSHVGSRVQAQEFTSQALRLGSAASSRLEGLVSNMGDDLPLAGALIQAGGIATMTNSAGRYALGLPPGVYEVRAEAPGYIGMTAVDQRLEEGGILSLALEMIPEQPTDAQAKTIDSKLHAMVGVPMQSLDDSGISLAALSTLPTTVRVVTNYQYPLPEGEQQDEPIVETMDIDEYLKGVVPYEMSPYWPLEALKVQAIAARSYAVTQRKHLPHADVCTTVHCQFRGQPQITWDTANRAVDETRGVVATYNDSVISAFFFGHCDGHTRDNEQVWTSGSPLAYCRSVICDCGYTTLYGHGVGMCQRGARVYADPAGDYRHSFVQVLKHYYTGIAVQAPVRISAPYHGQLVRAVATVTADTRFTGCRVDFYVDDQLKAQVSAPPYQAKLTTHGLSDGPHNVRVESISSLDPTEDQISLVVDNTPPSGTASAPTGWHRTTRIPFTLSANGSDALNVQFSNDWIWEAEDQLHQTGVLVNDAAALNGKAWRAAAGTHAAGAWYGPYTCLLPTAPTYQAYYRLKTSARTPTIDVARLDVADSQGLRILVEKTLSSSDLAANNTYEEIPLSFGYSTRAGTCATAAQDGIEFRTWFLGAGDLTLDRITVFSNPRALASTIEWEVAPRDGEQRVIVRFLDAAGNTFDRSVTVKVDRTPPVLSQQGPKSALAQDTGSGLDPASAKWSQSVDGGQTWGPWQPLSGLAFAQGTTSSVLLDAPSGTAADVRFFIRDVAGNAALTRGSRTFLPSLMRNAEG